MDIGLTLVSGLRLVLPITLSHETIAQQVQRISRFSLQHV